MSNETMSLERIQAILDSSPFIRFFGIRAVSADPSAGVLVLEMTLRAELERLQGNGQWHGGALAGLIDTAGDFALVLKIGAPVPTVNFRVDYLRPAMTPKLTATASIRRLGRNLAVVDIDVVDTEGRIVAVGRGCYGAQAG